jgi:hypothetical protein
MAAFRRLQAEGAGARRIARRLSIPKASAQKLMAGGHWQQQPDKVRVYNTLRQTCIDADTGVPTPDDLVKFGGLFDGPNRYSSQVEKDIYQVMKAAGVPPRKTQEVVRRMTAVNGGEIEVPARITAAMLREMVEDRLYCALSMLDDTIIAAAGPRELVQMISMLIDKRSLLKSEPDTFVMTNERREALHRATALFVEEAKRRGITLPGEFKDNVPPTDSQPPKETRPVGEARVSQPSQLSGARVLNGR